MASPIPRYLVTIETAAIAAAMLADSARTSVQLALTEDGMPPWRLAGRRAALQ